MDGPAPRRAGWDFVGRDREMAELVAGLEDARGGQGRLFLIAGEPGIGKTRLAEQLARHATERGARVVWGRCWEGGGAPPYWPWAQIIRTVAESCDDQTLISWLGAGSAFVGQMAPDLAARLGTPAITPIPSIESDAARFYLFEATAGFLKRAAAGQPLLLIVDDLHAADDPSLLLLRYLARDLRGARLLVVGTYRDVDVGRSPGMGHSLGELVREGQLTTLRGLARDHVKELIGDLVGAAPSEAMVLAVHQTTEGNPLFVREAVRLLASADMLEQPGRPGVPIPGSVRALMQQRLAPLSADAVQVLSAAAVVGRDFDLSLVGPACDLPVERVLGAVSEAVALGLVVEESVAPGRYRFSHSLMREVVYETLPIPVRAGLHRAVGEAIERLHGTDSDSHVAELARHFTEVVSVGESARALAYTRRAGDRAMQAHAYEEAVTEYQRALRALEIVSPDEDLRCGLLLDLGAAQVRAGRYPEAKEIHLQAAEIARRLGSPDQLARAALGFGEPQVEGGHVNRQLVALLREALDASSPQDSPLRARLLARLSVELTFSEEVHLTDSLSRQAVELARRLGHVPALGDALDARWMAVWGPDGLDERSGLAGEILSLAQETGDRDLELRGRAQRVTTSLESGDFLAVEADIAVYARLADELRMPVHQWTTTTMRAMRALLQGSFEAAETLAEEAFSLQPERPNAQWAHANAVALLRWEQGRLGELRETWQPLVDRFPRAAFARGWLALADIERGDRDSARRALQILAEQLPVRPRSALWLPGLALASLVSARLDDSDAARRLYPVLRPYGGHVIAMTMEHPVVCFGSASLYLALLATASSCWAEAGDHFEAAIRMHERLGAAPLLARTRYDYARMLIRGGQTADRGPAHELLDRAATTARTTGMAGLSALIVRLLEAAAGEAPSVERDAPAISVPPEPGRDRFQREGEYWTVSYDGVIARLKDSKGLRQIALLLAQPGRELHVTDLETMVSAPARPAASGPGSRVGRGELELRSDFGDAGELLDAEARAAYKARLDELQSELDQAEEFNDPIRAEQARDERAFLVRELERAVGLGGRNRRAASHAERARLNATRAIRAAMVNLAREHPPLGRHLAATIRTGRYCLYTPDPRTPVTWEL
ncbi:MAG: AAA family ATPase [Chloroflexi bacterium]|nr:AAA family ATPase [Chloroflexota bacterium]